jgi:hypothetical protein
MGKRITEEAIKKSGVITSDPKHGGDICIFPIETYNKTKLVTAPFVEEPSCLIVKTIFWSQQPDIDKYNEGTEKTKVFKDELINNKQGETNGETSD